MIPRKVDRNQMGDEVVIVGDRCPRRSEHSNRRGIAQGIDAEHRSSRAARVSRGRQCCKLSIRHIVTVEHCELDDIVEWNVCLDHGKQFLNTGIIGLAKGIKDGVEGITFEFELFDIAFPSSSPSAVLGLIIDTFCACFEAVRAGLLLVALRPKHQYLKTLQTQRGLEATNSSKHEVECEKAKHVVHR